MLAGQLPLFPPCRLVCPPHAEIEAASAKHALNADAALRNAKRILVMR
jgi:hypothetical protein